MEGGHDTWDEWKAAILGLPDAQLDAYLEEAEGFSSEQVAHFRAHESAMLPDDWAISTDAEAALRRFDDWRSQTAQTAGDAEPIGYQAARAAGYPGSGAGDDGSIDPDSKETHE